MPHFTKATIASWLTLALEFQFFQCHTSIVDHSYPYLGLSYILPNCAHISKAIQQLSRALLFAKLMFALELLESKGAAVCMAIAGRPLFPEAIVSS